MSRNAQYTYYTTSLSLSGFAGFAGFAGDCTIALTQDIIIVCERETLTVLCMSSSYKTGQWNWKCRLQLLILHQGECNCGSPPDSMRSLESQTPRPLGLACANKRLNGALRGSTQAIK